ncbi:hypothetical protein NVIRPANT_00469 [Pantoea sp. Nvir]|nr:hypothetical protein NVIRPANT_00469 [Pantoea sp. Nvir]
MGLCSIQSYHPEINFRDGYSVSLAHNFIFVTHLSNLVWLQRREV